MTNAVIRRFNSNTLSKESLQKKRMTPLLSHLTASSRSDLEPAKELQDDEDYDEVANTIKKESGSSLESAIYLPPESSDLHTSSNANSLEQLPIYVTENSNKNFLGTFSHLTNPVSDHNRLYSESNPSGTNLNVF